VMAKSILSTGQFVIKARPHEDDVVVRQKRGHPCTVYVQHTTFAPDQLLYRTRAPADLQALVFAKHAHVTAWFTNDEDDFVLLGTFRTMATRTYATGNRTFEITLSGTPAGSDSSRTVEHVYDKSLSEEIQVPGMDSIVASTDDAAFARACDHIDKWLTTSCCSERSENNK
jgi:hypothetical protein